MKKNANNEGCTCTTEVVLCYTCNGWGYILNAVLNNGNNLPCMICEGRGRLIKHVTVKYSILE